MFGSNKRILLKAKRNLTVISHTLISNLWTIRVHEIVTSEISLYWAKAQDLSSREIRICERQYRCQFLRSLWNGKSFQQKKFVWTERWTL